MDPGDSASPPIGPSLILGIDPGARATGYAVLSQQGRRLAVVDSGTIRLDSRADLGARLAELQRQLEAVLERNEPHTAAIEDIFVHRNARSALLLGHARGAALAAVARQGLLVQAYAPASVKQAVAGHGRADKKQMQRMVQVLLGMARIPAQDEADAIAVAVCHAMSGNAVQHTIGTRDHDRVAQRHNRT